MMGALRCQAAALVVDPALAVAFHACARHVDRKALHPQWWHVLLEAAAASGVSVLAFGLVLR
eukprot:322505-Prorocentrum_lima.AAC.1